MLRKILIFLAGIAFLSASLMAAELHLTKSRLGLDDLFYTYQQNSVQMSGSPKCNGVGLVASLYRDAIQSELIADTLWVKVFITTETASQKAAVAAFRSLKLRALSQFGNIFAARIDLRQLPEIDQLPFVLRIEPVAPDGSAARASVSAYRGASVEKKK
jgi:hypothetical protein